MIPLSIHPLFWVVAFLIGWLWTTNLLGAFLSVLLILFSVLFHEFGHALTARFFGQKARIELTAFGGFTYRQGNKLKLWQEFLVVLNGPFFGFTLFGAAYLAYIYLPISNPIILFSLKFLFIANFFWTVMNLIPVLPLDGGHLMSLFLEALFGFRGVKIALILGLIISVCLSFFFFSFGLFIVGALFLLFTFEGLRSLRYYKLYSEKDRDPKLQELVKEADEEFSHGLSQQALDKLEKVRKETDHGILYTMATQEMAEIFKEQHRFDEAYKVLMPLKKDLSGGQLCLLHFLAYMNRDYQTVVELGDGCYQEEPTYQTALINALGHGALNHPEACAGWLDCSIREGLPSLKEVLMSEELEKLLTHPLFKKYQPSSK
jgi:stage IV sporulation protein FB